MPVRTLVTFLLTLGAGVLLGAWCAVPLGLMIAFALIASGIIFAVAAAGAPLTLGWRPAPLRPDSAKTTVPTRADSAGDGSHGRG